MALRFEKERPNHEGLNQVERIARLEVRLMGHGKAPGLEDRLEAALGELAELRLRVVHLEVPWWLRWCTRSGAR